jgi:hypothetical protein
MPATSFQVRGKFSCPIIFPASVNVPCHHRRMYKADNDRLFCYDPRASTTSDQPRLTARPGRPKALRFGSSTAGQTNSPTPSALTPHDVVGKCWKQPRSAAKTSPMTRQR